MSRRKYYKKVKDQSILENMHNMQLVKHYVNQFENMHMGNQNTSVTLINKLDNSNNKNISATNISATNISATNISATNNNTIFIEGYEVLTNKIEIEQDTETNANILYIDTFNVFVIILYIIFID